QGRHPPRGDPGRRHAGRTSDAEAARLKLRRHRCRSWERACARTWRSRPRWLPEGRSLSAPRYHGHPTCTAPTMAKGNPLQEQLLKAGLVKKSKVSAVAREQHVARHARAAAGPNEIELEAQRLRAEKVERDRALEAERR